MLLAPSAAAPKNRASRTTPANPNPNLTRTGKRTRSAYTPPCHAASPGFKLVLSGRISCTWVDEDFEVVVVKYDRIFLGEGGHNLRLF